MPTPPRQEALDLLYEHTHGESLRRHALAVEAAVRAYARLLGGDEELWGLAGLLHDLDYERFPSLEDHPFRGVEILRERTYPEEIIHAVLAHAPHTGTPRLSPLDRVLFACDEICGLIIAAALVQPSKRLADVKVSSVKRKLKDKAFARSVNREEIRQGVQELEVDMDEHIGRVLEALRSAAPELGL
ncbi:MAG: HD domain-containing protein [Acidobacteriota bacterium]|nr:HD domain-containing protein [Acidobacteriota bacterium]